MRQIESAKLSCAKMALACPGMYPQGSELMHARQAFELAKERLAKAELAWANLIAPAKGWAPDPLAEGTKK